MNFVPFILFVIVSQYCAVISSFEVNVLPSIVTSCLLICTPSFQSLSDAASVGDMEEEKIYNNLREERPNLMNLDEVIVVPDDEDGSSEDKEKFKSPVEPLNSYDFYTNQNYEDSRKQPQYDEDWQDVTLLLHNPQKHILTLNIGNKLMTLRMVNARGIVAPGAQLRRHPDGPPEPLLAKNSCHFHLFEGTVNVGSLYTCHPLGHHVMLMLDDAVMDVIPKASLSVSNPKDILTPPDVGSDDSEGIVEDYDTSNSEKYQPQTFPQYVARNIIDTSKFRNVFSDHVARQYFKNRKRKGTFETAEPEDEYINNLSKMKATKQKSTTYNEEDDGTPNVRSRRSSDTDDAADEMNSLHENKKFEIFDSIDGDWNKFDEVPRKSKRRYMFPLTVEIALFLDAVLLDNLYSFYAENQVNDLILSLMNNVQAFFHQSNLGRRVDLSITQLYLLRTQPADLPTHNGHRLKLLQSFCNYQKERIHRGFSRATNWDLAVYLSGIDLVSENEKGDISDITMGLTYTGGVCNPERSCIISEFGTTNAFGKPSPSAGALASLILAHEIGHSLGLRHDGNNNTCIGQNNMMAAGRGSRGGTTWSSCSQESIWQQKGSCLRNSPGATIWNEAERGQMAGQKFDAVAQCQLYFGDHDATLTWPTSLRDLCSSTQCSSPHRLTSYYAGPAFEGTFCGRSNWCRNGDCVAWTPADNVTVVAGGLGMWEEGPCTSACLDGGTGWRETRRPCNNPSPRNSDEGCITTTYKTDFCDDRQICGTGLRKDIKSVIGELCGKVSERYPDALAKGHQMGHVERKPWQACILYCHLRSNPNGTQVWTPRYLFRDDPTVPTHLPPGAPCHVDAIGTTYRCFHRTCVPHKDEFVIPFHRDLYAGLFEYRDAPSLDDLVINAGPPTNAGSNSEDYPEFDLDDLF